eukprot:scaffold100177_cov43-Phaeocystis_antarctica.AAC.2
MGELPAAEYGCKAAGHALLAWCEHDAITTRAVLEQTNRHPGRKTHSEQLASCATHLRRHKRAPSRRHHTYGPPNGSRDCRTGARPTDSEPLYTSVNDLSLPPSPSSMFFSMWQPASASWAKQLYRMVDSMALAVCLRRRP